MKPRTIICALRIVGVNALLASGAQAEAPLVGGETVVEDKIDVPPESPTEETEQEEEESGEEPSEEPLVGGETILEDGITVPSEGSSTSSEEDNARLRAAVEENQRTIAELKKQLEESNSKHEKDLKSVREDLKAVPGAPGSASAQDASLADHGTVLPYTPSVHNEHLSAPRPGNAPLDPEYEGFFQFYDTGIWLRYGGYIKLDAIYDSRHMADPNTFTTRLILVDGQQGYDSPTQFNIIAKQTRFSLELRAATPIGASRLFYENDFFGNSLNPDMVYRLRHAYIQIANLAFGQTWNNFVDPDSVPNTLDFAGPNAEANFRQPQVRYTLPIVPEHVHLALSVEQPKTNIAFASSDTSQRNVAPDMIARLRIEGQRGHIQTAALGRTFAYRETSQTSDSVLGWGANIAGSFHSWGKDLVVGGAVIGKGIGRYIQDLGDGNAVVVTPDFKLETLFAWGGYLGYRHFWLDNLTSQVTYGHVHLDASSLQGDDAYHSTHYAQGNVIWAALDQFSVGAEFLWGHKKVQGGQTGTTERVQMSLIYNL